MEGLRSKSRARWYSMLGSSPGGRLRGSSGSRCSTGEQLVPRTPAPTRVPAQQRFGTAPTRGYSNRRAKRRRAHTARRPGARSEAPPPAMTAATCRLGERSVLLRERPGRLPVRGSIEDVRPVDPDERVVLREAGRVLLEDGLVGDVLPQLHLGVEVLGDEVLRVDGPLPHPLPHAGARAVPVVEELRPDGAREAIVEGVVGDRREALPDRPAAADRRAVLMPPVVVQRERRRVGGLDGG